MLRFPRLTQCLFRRRRGRPWPNFGWLLRSRGGSHHFSIFINNHSGTKKNYAIFTAAPNITPSVERTWTSVIAVLRGVVSGSGEATFSMPKQVYAICGTSKSDQAAQILIEVLDRRPVSLGVRSSDGTLIPGTALEVEVSDESPGFTTGVPPPPSGDETAFCIQTGHDFTFEAAKDGDFILGLGGARIADKRLEQDVGRAYAFFIPQPNTTYQIKPSNVFCIAAVSSDVQPRTLTTPDSNSSTCIVDFNELQSDDVQIVHDTKGDLIIQTAPTACRCLIGTGGL
ncbi:hypothetical protein FN846DRAFT_818166 [Sphaerosporella brunnea]|uniref:Uncharacterized protein n=1 Tax=Sphaerosporella brunnea TaxID=1250544 RepID=A0A5J5EKG8_9PEZI|nr:hypothetical protein FN846DRAFT_818166 [Sphaerosporella brunnea]